MTETLTVHGIRLVLGAGGGPALAGEGDANDWIAAARSAGADIVAIPKSRFDEAFFRPVTRVAGAVIQKFVNYRIRLVILGDIDAELATSKAFTDFVREANKGTQVWFLADLKALAVRLKP